MHTRIGNSKVRQPICSAGHGYGLGTKLQREHFGDYDPCYWPPCRSKKGDEDTNEKNEDLLSCKVFDGNCFTDDGNDVFAKTHANATNEQETTSTKALDTIYSWNGHPDIDSAGHNGYDESILDTGIFEERDSIIKDEIDCQLLTLISWR